MKYLLVLVVVVIVLWLTLRSHRKTPAPPGARRAARRGEPDRMVACAHCGVHLPQSDALSDAGGRPYCSDPHRLAGPR